MRRPAQPPIPAAAPAGPSERFGLIEASRGVAALLVVLMHSVRLMEVPQFSGPGVLGGLFGAGYVGVDFFFVLSGFILTYMHHDQLGSGVRHLPNYFWNRFTRLYPIYWTVLAASMAVSVLTRLQAQRTPLLEMGLSDIPGTLLLWVGGAWPAYVGVAWSLQFEVLFYLSFAVLLVHLRLGLALYALWSLALLAQLGGLVPGPLPLQMGDPFCLEFMMGVLTGLAARRRPLPDVRLGVAVALFAAATAFEWYGPFPHHSPAGRLVMGLASVVMLVSLVTQDQRGRVRAPQWLRRLGSVSYSLYLVHCLVITVCLAVLARLGVYRQLPPLAIVALVVAASVAGGWLLGRRVELPLVRWLKR